MNKNSFSRGIIIFVFPLLMFILQQVVSSIGSSTADYDTNYTETDVFIISNLDVEVEAYSDRTAYIKETISVDFYQARAAIVRDLPINGGIEYRDIKVEGRAYKVTKSGGFLMVDMDADRYTPGLDSRTYIISYILDYSKAIKSANADSIPLNVVGQGWPVYIENAHISITLPDTPRQSYYYVGKQGRTGGADRLSVTASGNQVELNTLDILYPYEGVTVGYDMPEGVMHSDLDMSIVYNILIGIAYLALIYVLFILFGRDRALTPVVNFTAPYGLNPAECGYLIDTTASPEDMTSLIYYWAAQGHLNILDNGDGKDIMLKKVSDLDDEHKAYEMSMFSALFKGRSTVKISSLKESYYMVLTSAQSRLRTEYSSKLFNNASKVASILALIGTVLVVGIWTLISSMSVSSGYNNPAGFFSIILSAISYAVANGIIKREPKLTKSKSNYYLFYCLIVGVLSTIQFFILKYSCVPLYASIIISLAFAIGNIIIPFIIKKSDAYSDTLDQLTGFRDFILNAEKDRLELLLKDNPQYYYDVLPYANVLGVSDIWMHKFDSLKVEPPYWYYSNRPFNILLFNSHFRSSMNHISTTMVSRPAPQGSSGGGFGGGGGGGFSGGGFGGGGGHSR